MPQQPFAWLGTQVRPTPGPRMIGMRVGDERTIHRPLGINVEPTDRTKQSVAINL